jgi:hypothetical protein
MPTWTKSPEDLKGAFATALDAFPGAERRQMFGYPAAFVNGNLWTSLHQARWVVRLGPPDSDALLALPGSGPFEPMPGRAMSGFYLLPDSVVADPAALRGWLERAWQTGVEMPPKADKPKKPAKPKA